MFLLDTVVLSEFSKRPSLRNRNVVDWVGKVRADGLFISVIGVAEIERGIERQRDGNPAFADRLAAWLDVTLSVYDGRILPINVAIARRWGRLAYRLGNRSLDPAIAATALEHGLTVATRNVADFVPAGVPVVNPFEPSARTRA